jgi:hypothetical protein
MTTHCDKLVDVGRRKFLTTAGRRLGRNLQRQRFDPGNGLSNHNGAPKRDLDAVRKRRLGLESVSCPMLHKARRS